MDTVYRAIGRIIWRIYLSIERHRHMPPLPDLYILYLPKQKQSYLCTIDAAGTPIVFGARHD